MQTSLSPSVCSTFLGCQIEKAVDELNLPKKVISCHPSGFGLPPLEDRGSGYRFAVPSRHQPATLKVATQPSEATTQLRREIAGDVEDQLRDPSRKSIDLSVGAGDDRHVVSDRDIQCVQG